MLEIRGLTVGYGKQPVLENLDFDVDVGEVVAILGANGVGKSTLLRTLAGLQAPLSGSVRFEGSDIGRKRVHERVKSRLVLVPEGQQSFPEMSVRENLLLSAQLAANNGAQLAAALEPVYEIFPKLKERESQAAGSLSGGERQMLAIARALLAKPRVLMLDEPSHGLAPLIVEHLADVIRQIAQQTSILLVEQNLSVPSRCATEVLVIEDRGISLRGNPDEILNSPRVVAAYLGMD